MMPDLKDLTIHLAGIHINEHDKRRAYEVAGHIVESTLGERWHHTPANQRQKLIRNSGDRLWTFYKKERRNKEKTPKEAAQQAIFDELIILKQLLNPNDVKPNNLMQIDDI